MSRVTLSTRKRLNSSRFSGTTDAITSDIDRVGELVKEHHAGDFIFAKSKQDEQDLWAARKHTLFNMVQNRPEGTSIWSTDVAVPISRMADIISEGALFPDFNQQTNQARTSRNVQGRLQ